MRLCVCPEFLPSPPTHWKDVTAGGGRKRGDSCPPTLPSLLFLRYLLLYDVALNVAASLSITAEDELMSCLRIVKREQQAFFFLEPVIGWHHFLPVHLWTFFVVYLSGTTFLPAGRDLNHRLHRPRLSSRLPTYQCCNKRAVQEEQVMGNCKVMLCSTRRGFIWLTPNDRSDVGNIFLSQMITGHLWPPAEG